MTATPSKRSIRLQQDREKSIDLLKVYGCLLTAKQYSMSAGYCLEGKSFSQIAREQTVSRQAVHEAVRSVQRMLHYYEEKLGLIKTGKIPGTGAKVSHAVESLTALKSKITRKGVIYSPDWLMTDLNEVLDLLVPKKHEAADADVEKVTDDAKDHGRRKVTI